MTIREAIDTADRLKPNQYDYDTKVQWLSNLDGMIFREVIKTHDQQPVEMFHGYEKADSDTPLLIPFPYDDDVYVSYLHSQIDKANGETAKYNASATQFNAAYIRFQDWYGRTHRCLPMRSQFKI